MSIRAPITLALEIQPESQPIEGKLRTQDGTERTFTGTLGLLAAIESARNRQAPSPAEQHGLTATSSSSTSDSPQKEPAAEPTKRRGRK
jgi:hypothetical protein